MNLKDLSVKKYRTQKATREKRRPSTFSEVARTRQKNARTVTKIRSQSLRKQRSSSKTSKNSKRITKSTSKSSGLAEKKVPFKQKKSQFATNIDLQDESEESTSERSIQRDENLQDLSAKKSSSQG